MSPQISLCLIVKDEEDMLPDFLRACEGCWDELVAVDTGSTDRTRALLEVAGAQLIDRPWSGDFAAARNSALQAASGEWALILDPDERPGPGFAEELRALAAEPAVGAATVLVRNRLAHGHTRDVHLLRLFRLRPTTRFEHAIHEDAFASVQATLRAEGRELAALQTPVEHLGYLPDRALVRGKRERDSAVLRRCLEEDPDDLYCHFKRLELARFWGDAEGLAAAAPVAEAALRRCGPLDERSPWGGDLVVLLVRAVAEDAAAALIAAETLAPLVAASPALILARGEWLEETGDLDGAADAFEVCLDIGDDPTAQLVLTRPLLGLARVALAQGRFEDALEDVDAALSTAPRDPEALLAALSLRTGDARRAFAAEWREQHGDTVELSQAEGESALLAGEAAEAVAPLRRVVGDPPKGRPAIRLAQALLLSDDADSAVGVLQGVLAELPEAAIGLLVCDTVAGRSREFDVDLGRAQADGALLAWLQLLEDRPDLLALFARHARPLLTVFPWLEQIFA